MELIRDLLIQIAIIILPLFLYEAIRLNRYQEMPPKPNRYFIMFLSSVTLVLSMTYSICFGNVCGYNFHPIPIVSGFLYGGIVGLIPAVIFVAYEWLLKGMSFLPVLEVIFLLIVPLFLSKKWSLFSRDKKLILAFMISSFYVLVSLVLGMINVLLETGFTPYISQIYSGFIFASLIMVMTMVFQVYLTEYLNENALLRTEMQKSEKLNIVSELAASVAHEVRNPLTVVRGFIQLLESTEDVKNKDYMRLVLAELDRAEQIISDYLNLARPQIEKKEHICLSAQLIEMTTLMSSFAAMQGVYLQVEISESLYTIGDKTKLKQAIMNVVKNGIEAIQGNKGYLKVTAIQKDETIIIRVKDSGVGMTNEQLARLGQPYYSLKEKGTGLGLMVTFSILQAHNGTLEYKSESGKGTEAIIILPAVQNKE
ncbi:MULTISPECIES: sporulation sensor histidine kinase KinB [Bacillus]|jgi:two-component system sporulation sensor kinase B|uniref:histidine kinase n=10 Tax=Bacillus cereus group TaxID=86661 RepID=Q819H4_BACCR|nr:MULTISPECIES: sporulation sensor histidine kinase KinB [Bacillus]MBJ6719259.1 sporulation sensor histidine kinase KinB [Bacillus sp. PR5]MBR3335660.1 sporulation sensor histidine kinase KinB [Bacillus sp. (in: firmicutes)]MDV8107601.1 sporulation sensor histidine kinase KinB [Bacillus sp. BAU-SS-2023]CGF79286.1 histidine kinase [Streptococcus pneumoniae]AAP10927.1 Sporulation kinase B [Bacillus cereus ATCC 14579]